MGPPPAEFCLVAVAFTVVMAVFGYAVHVVSGTAADLSYSVAKGVADGVKRWVNATVRERPLSSSPPAAVLVSHVHGVQVGRGRLR